MLLKKGFRKNFTAAAVALWSQMINGAATLILLSLDLLASILNEIWPYDVPRCHTTLNGRKKTGYV